MRTHSLLHILGSLALTGLVAVGCSKESNTAENSAQPGNTAPEQTQTATPAPAATPAAGNLNARLSESQTAINAREYEKAATTLMALQQAPLNEQQAEAVAKQMRQLQSSLAGAVASGDPQAKAAADKLRQSTPR